MGSQQRPRRKFTMRKTKPAVWLDVKHLGKDNFSVVLTIHTRLRDEMAHEAWRRVQTMALEWLRSQGVDEQNLHADANPQLRLAQHNGKGSLSNAQLAEQSKRAAEAREMKMLEMLRSRAPFRVRAIHGEEFSDCGSFHMPHAEREALTDPEVGICTSRSLKVARRSKQQSNKGRSQRQNLRNKRARLSAKILRHWAAQRDECVKQGEIVKAHYHVRRGRSSTVEHAVVMQPPIEDHIRLRFSKGNHNEQVVPVEWALPMKTAAEYLTAKGNSKRLRRKELQRRRRQVCC